MIRDKIGQPIAPGCLIVYGHALGRCAGLRIGKVLAVKTVPDRWRADRIEHRITVQGVDDDWEHTPMALTGRVGVLQFPERIVVLSRDLVPAPILALLDPIATTAGASS